MIRDRAAVQLLLEDRMYADGVNRYHARKQQVERSGAGSSTPAAKELLPLLVPQVSRKIAELVGEEHGKRGPTPKAIRVLQGIDPDQLAVDALRVTFDAVGRNLHFQKTLIEMGQAVADTLLIERVMQADRDRWSDKIRRINRENDPRYRRRAFRRSAQKAGFETEEWGDDILTKIGEPLLNATLYTELFEVYLEQETETTRVNRLGLTEQGRALVAEIDGVASLLRPRFLPTLIPPRDWEAFDTGCYQGERIAARVPLVRTVYPEHRRMISRAIRNGAMRPVLTALNAIQRTPYAINAVVLAAVEWAWDEGLDLKKFPRRSKVLAEPLPANFHELEPKQRASLVAQRKQVARMNRGVDCAAIQMAQDLETARLLSEQAAFWLPHNLDFRGRVYPVPSFNHQRSDHVSAMFRFATGKPVGFSGAQWLQIHLANNGDFGKVSKKSFADRIAWVREHHSEILAIARDWKTHRLWMKADKPFSFLAACVEYAGWVEQGDEFISHLPIALDGSNSGVQHYTAALRAEEGRLVCLTPEDAPRDLYAEVAKQVAAEVEIDRGKHPAAEQWLAHGINRSVTKRPVMTYGYGSEVFGFKQQLMEDLMTPLEIARLRNEIPAHPFGSDGGYAAAGYLAAKIYQAVTRTLPRTDSGKRFFQACAAALAHEEKAMSWTTPLGFPVLHKYAAWQTKEVSLWLYDRTVPVWQASEASSMKDGSAQILAKDGSIRQRYRARVNVKPRDAIIKSKQRSAVAPNIIHSMDATHLLQTVLMARQQDIHAFLLIHDSFATHAADTDAFFWIIRDAFVDLYERVDLFEAIREATAAQLSAAGKRKLPATPPRGGLDLHSVRSSLYAFA